MDKKQVFSLFNPVLMQLTKYYSKAITEEFSFLGINVKEFLIGVVGAKCFDPDPVSVERYRKRIPYNSPIYYESPIQKLIETGFLETTPEGGYLLNQQGHILFRRTINTIYQQLESCIALRTIDMENLKLFLARLVQASLLSSDPPGKWSILYNRKLDPGHDVTAIISIDQYLSDLIVYRDDAHLAAWQHHDVSGHAWDILQRIWEGEADNIVEIRRLLAPRLWSEQETKAAIEELVKKEWITKDDHLVITKKGKTIRDEAEARTDEYYFSSWNILSSQEIDELGNLLTSLKEALKSQE